jgi:long-subunit acyl-CoA synthetase (AMP-forming)
LIHSLLAITTVFALLPSFSTPFELTHAIKLSKATTLFVSPKFLPLAIRVGQECGISDSRICVLSGNVQGRLSFADLIKRAREMSMPQVLVRAAKRDTLAYLIFSSGTSGLPKGRSLLVDSACLPRFAHEVKQL